MYCLVINFETLTSKQGKPYQVFTLVAPTFQLVNIPGSQKLLESISSQLGLSSKSSPFWYSPFKVFVWNNLFDTTTSDSPIGHFTSISSNNISVSNGFLNASYLAFYSLQSFKDLPKFSELEALYNTYFKQVPSYQEFSSLIQSIQSQDGSVADGLSSDSSLGDSSSLIVHLKLFINQQVESLYHLYSQYPAAHTFHHAFPGGLLVHVTEMLRLLNSIIPSFQKITPFSPTMVLLGILYHDFGKTIEYSQSGDYQEPFYLQGHVYLSSHHLQNELTNFFSTISDNIPQDSVTKFINRCTHLTLSHHALANHQDWGSPILPHSVEAFLLTHLDALSGHGDQFNKKPEFSFSQFSVG